MAQHEFSLILSGVPELTPELADTLFDATDGDIELNIRDGIACVDVVRESSSLEDAISTAMEDVERADCGVRVIRVESESANTVARINAGLLGATQPVPVYA